MLRTLLSSLGIYKIYGKWLKMQINTGRMPEHIGIILDGNRRWAVSRYLTPWQGHWEGADHVKKFLQWCLDLNIKSITLYAFSTENFNRPSREVEEIMKIFENTLNDVIASKVIHENRVRIRALGRINLLPDNLQKLVGKIEAETKDYDNFYLNVALAYGGRAEIIDATRAIAEEVKEGIIDPKDIDEDVMEKHLYTAYLPQPDPDLIIRTSGQFRLSNFLLWQSAYSELFIVDVYWPEFREIDLKRVIRSFQYRNRRFGK
jgi:tritrans,polycis-undecaprenyl-diphosphate synthase [geranylgeranyl-diphosphate specific]